MRTFGLVSLAAMAVSALFGIAALEAGAQPPAATPLTIGPLNPETVFADGNPALRCRRPSFQLLEPNTRVCELAAANNQILGQTFFGSHIWLINGRVSSFELGFPVEAYPALAATLTARFGPPRSAPRQDPTERTVQWTAGHSRVSLTSSPQRRIAVLFGAYRPGYSEAWGRERVFAGNYIAGIPSRSNHAPWSFAGCHFTMSPEVAESFYRANPDARRIQRIGQPHYWLEVRGRRRDTGPGSEFSQAGMFPCETRATAVISARRLP